MIITKHFCDICGREIHSFERKYEFTERERIFGYPEDITVDEMCKDCFNEIRSFIKEKKQQDNK